MKALTAFNLILWLLFSDPSVAQQMSIDADYLTTEIAILSELQDDYPDSAIDRVSALLLGVDSFPAQIQFEIYLAAGQVFDNTSVYEQAMLYFSKALEFSDQVTENQKLTLNSELLELYTSLRDTLQCNTYVQRIKAQLKDSDYEVMTLADVYYDFGTYYWYFEKYDSSIFYLDKAISYILSSRPVDYNYLTYVKMELAEAYWLSGEHEKMGPILKEVKSYPLFENFTKYAKNYVLYIDAIYQFEKGNDERSFLMFDSLLNKPFVSIMLEEKYNILGVYINFLQETGDFDKGFQLQLERQTIYEELTAKERRNTLAALELTNSVREKQRQLEVQKAVIKERNEQLQLSYIFLFIILLLLSGMLFILLQNVKARKKVQLQNEHIQSLINELHHRVKNNLQVISSLLGLQSMKLKDERAREAVSEGKDRIKAMSLIHERLYKNNDLSSVNLEEYIKELAYGVAYSFGFSDKSIFRFDIEENALDLNRLMPLGLIINELVSNSFKYAFHNSPAPEITISLDTLEDHVIFHYRDNGPGLPVGFELEKTDSFGLKLIKLLSKQIKADMSIKMDEKSGFSMQLKIVK